MVSDISREAAPDPLPLTRGANFKFANLKALRTSPKSAARLLELSLRMLKNYPDIFMGGSDGSIKVVDVADASDSLSHAEGRNEASVVCFDYGESQVKIMIISFLLVIEVTDAKRTR